MSEIQKLTSLSNDQLKLASEVLSNAFQKDPIFSKLIPNDKERHKTLFKIFKFQIKYCLRYGVVLSTSNTKGISLWYPPKNAFISIWKSMKSGSLSLIFKIKRYIFGFFSSLKFLKKYTKGFVIECVRL